MAGRVQVSPLDPPERLQPSGIQSDTFAAPAQPVINKDLERLSDALGGFASTLGQVHRHQVALQKQKQAEQDKLFVENAEREYNIWKVQRTDTEALAAMHRGEAPYQADRRTAAFIEKDWGQMEARRFAQTVQEKLQGPDANLSLDPNFDPAAYVRDQATQFMGDKRFNHSRWATREFGNGVEHVAKSTGEWHKNNVGRRNTEAIETAAFNTLSNRFDAAVQKGLSPEQFSEWYRQEYVTLGPRLGGGALDLNYKRLDEIFLDKAERAAASGDRKAAEMALAVVDVPRIDPTTGQALGSLKDNPKLREKAERVQVVATKTIATLNKQEAEQRITAMSADAAMKMDGSLHTLQDVKLDFGSGVSLSKPAEKIREEAVQTALTKVRQEKGGMDLRAEIELAAKNNVTHPDVIPQLIGEATAALTLISTKGKEGEAVERLVRAGDLYTQVSDINMKYAKDQVKNKNADVFETYTALVRAAKMPPAAAAQHVLNIYAQTDYDKVKEADVRRSVELETKIKGMDFYTGFGGEEGSMFGDALKNGGEIRRKVVNLATVLMRSQGINADDALKFASQRVEAEALWVNGRAIFGVNGLSKGDEPAIEAVIKKSIKDFPDTFKRAGITDPSQVTIVTNPNGEALMVNKENHSFIQAYDPVAKKELSEFMKVRPTDVLKSQATMKELKDKYEREKVTRSRANNKKRDEIMDPLKPYAPDAILRNWLQSTPNAKGLGDIIRDTLRNQ